MKSGNLQPSKRQRSPNLGATTGSNLHPGANSQSLPKVAFGPVRVAVTGRRVSPPLFESLEILGRDATLARLQAVR